MSTSSSTSSPASNSSTNDELHLRTGDTLVFDRNCNMMMFPIGWVVCQHAKARGTPYDHIGPIVVYPDNENNNNNNQKNKKNVESNDDKKPDKQQQQQQQQQEKKKDQESNKSKIKLQNTPLLKSSSKKNENEKEKSNNKEVEAKKNHNTASDNDDQSSTNNNHVVPITSNLAKVGDANFRGVVLRSVAEAISKKYNNALLVKMLLTENDNNNNNNNNNTTPILDYDQMVQQAQEAHGSVYKKVFSHMISAGLAAYPDRREAALSYSSALMRRRLRYALLLEQEQENNSSSSSSSIPNGGGGYSSIAQILHRRRLMQLEIEEKALLRAYELRRARLEHSGTPLRRILFAGLNNHDNNIGKKGDGYFCSEITSSVLQAGGAMADFPAATALTPSDFAWQTEAGSFPIVHHSFNPKTCYTPMIQVKPKNKLGSCVSLDENRDKLEDDPNTLQFWTLADEMFVKEKAVIDEELMKRRSTTPKKKECTNVGAVKMTTGEVFWFDDITEKNDDASSAAQNKKDRFIHTQDLHCVLVEEEVDHQKNTKNAQHQQSSSFWSSLFGSSNETCSSNNAESNNNNSNNNTRPAPISWLASPPANSVVFESDFNDDTASVENSKQQKKNQQRRRPPRRGILARNDGTILVGTSSSSSEPEQTSSNITTPTTTTRTIAPSEPVFNGNESSSSTSPSIFHVKEGTIIYRNRLYKKGDIVGLQELLSRYVGVFSRNRFQGWENELHRELSSNRLMNDPERPLLLCGNTTKHGPIRAGSKGAVIEEFSASELGAKLIKLDRCESSSSSSQQLSSSLCPPSSSTCLASTTTTADSNTSVMNRSDSLFSSTQQRLISLFRTIASTAVGDSDFILTPREAAILLGGDNTLGDRKMLKQPKIKAVSVISNLRAQYDSADYRRVAENNEAVSKLKSHVIKWILFQGRMLVKDNEDDPIVTTTSSSENINPRKKNDAFDSSKLANYLLRETGNTKKNGFFSWDSPCVHFADIVRANEILANIDDALTKQQKIGRQHQQAKDEASSNATNNNNNNHHQADLSKAYDRHLSPRHRIFVDIVLRPLVESIYYSHNQDHHHDETTTSKNNKPKTVINIVDEINDELKIIFDSFDSKNFYITAADHRMHNDKVEDPSQIVDILMKEGDLQLGTGAEKVVSALKAVARDNLSSKERDELTQQERTAVLRCLDNRLGGECNDVSLIFLSSDRNAKTSSNSDDPLAIIGDYHQLKMEEKLKLRYIIPRLWMAVFAGVVASSVIPNYAAFVGYNDKAKNAQVPATIAARKEAARKMSIRILATRALVACTIHSILLSIAIKLWVHYFSREKLKTITIKNDQQETTTVQMAPRHRRWQLLKYAAFTGLAASLATYPFEAAVARVLRKSSAPSSATSPSTTTAAAREFGSSTLYNLYVQLSGNLRYWKKTSYRGIFPWSIFAFSPYVGALQWLYIHELVLPLGFISPQAAPSFLFPQLFDTAPSSSFSSSTVSSTYSRGGVAVTSTSSNDFDYLFPFSSTSATSSSQKQAIIHRVTFVGLGLTGFLALTHPIDRLRYMSLTTSNRSVGSILLSNIKNEGLFKTIRGCYSGFLTQALPRHIGANIMSYTIFGLCVRGGKMME